MLSFKINLCTVVEGQVLEACRYDTCHGRLHVHRFWLGHEETVDLGVPAHADYRRQFAACANDMEGNGAAYVAALRNRRVRDD